MLLALAAAISAMVLGSVVLMSRFGKRRDFGACSSWAFVTRLPFVCVEDRVVLPALSTVCDSEAANKSAIDLPLTAGMIFLVKRGESKDSKSFWVLVF